MSERVGRRRGEARGFNPPGFPSGGRARRCRGPKAEVPKVLRGSKVPRTVRAFCRTRVPSATVRVVRRLSSALAISIRPLRGNGVAERREKVSFCAAGRLSGFARWMGDEGGCAMLRLIRLTDGRAG